MVLPRESRRPAPSLPLRGHRTDSLANGRLAFKEKESQISKATRWEQGHPFRALSCPRALIVQACPGPAVWASPGLVGMQVLRLGPRPAVSADPAVPVSLTLSFCRGVWDGVSEAGRVPGPCAPPCRLWNVPGSAEATPQAFGSSEPCPQLSWVDMQQDRRAAISHVSILPVLELPHWGFSPRLTAWPPGH